MSVVENIQNARAKIAAAAEKSGRTAEDVLLLAVSKTKPVELIGEAVDTCRAYRLRSTCGKE